VLFEDRSPQRAVPAAAPEGPLGHIPGSILRPEDTGGPPRRRRQVRQDPSAQSRARGSRLFGWRPAPPIPCRVVSDGTGSLSRLMMPPRGEAGGSVPWSLELGRSGDLRAVAQDFEAFPTGVRFTVRVQFRPGVFDPRPVHGQPSQLPGTPGGAAIAVTFSDGRWGSARPGSLGEADVVLRYFMGSGGAEEFTAQFWLSPLPSAGDLTWRVAWPELGVHDQTITVQADELIKAAGKAERLW
jgi:hypothetical protein